MSKSGIALCVCTVICASHLHLFVYYYIFFGVSLCFWCLHLHNLQFCIQAHRSKSMHTAARNSDLLEKNALTRIFVCNNEKVTETYKIAHGGASENGTVTDIITVSCLNL